MSALVVERTPCMLCAHPDCRLALRAEDALNESVAVFVCPRCRSYLPYYGSGEERVRTAASEFAMDVEPEWASLSLSEAQTLSDSCGGIVKYYNHLLPAGVRVLELGAGRGALLHALRRAGYDAIGCEPLGCLVRAARRVFGLRRQILLQLPAEDFIALGFERRWRPTAVFMWHVIEHLYQPLELLRSVSRLLGNGGVLIAQVPTLDQRALVRPHLFLPTESSVYWIAREAGYEVVDINYDHDRAFLGFVLRSKSPVPA